MQQPTTAVILAAGMGLRLRDVHQGAPKGLLRINGETLSERSLRLLRQAGMQRIVLVTGYEAGDYAALSERWPELQLVHNPGFATNGSMASLAYALEVLGAAEPFLLLESDLFYEARALDLLLGEAPDVMLISGPTGAGDEVWVHAPDDRLVALSKDATELPNVQGELVGICRISAALGQAMAQQFADHVREYGHARMCYETDALVAAAQTHPVAVHLEPNLLWGEIDDPAHYRRVSEHLAPQIQRLEAAKRDA